MLRVLLRYDRSFAMLNAMLTVLSRMPPALRRIRTSMEKLCGIMH
jgi:hypothetical protein